MFFITDIYILLTQTGTIPSKALKLYTKKPFNHISIGLDEDLDGLYSFGRRTLHNPLNGGFVHENINGGVFALFKDTTCSLYKLEVGEAEYKKLLENIEYFNQRKEEYRYNFLGLLTAIFGHPLHREKHYYCTQFVGKLLQTSDIVKFEKDFSLLKPTDFCKLNNFILVYQGILSDYNYKKAPRYSGSASS